MAKKATKKAAVKATPKSKVPREEQTVVEVTMAEYDPEEGLWFEAEEETLTEHELPRRFVVKPWDVKRDKKFPSDYATVTDAVEAATLCKMAYETEEPDLYLAGPIRLSIFVNGAPIRSLNVPQQEAKDFAADFERLISDEEN